MLLLTTFQLWCIINLSNLCAKLTALVFTLESSKNPQRYPLTWSWFLLIHISVFLQVLFKWLVQVWLWLSLYRQINCSFLRLDYYINYPSKKKHQLIVTNLIQSQNFKLTINQWIVDFPNGKRNILQHTKHKFKVLKCFGLELVTAAPSCTSASNPLCLHRSSWNTTTPVTPKRPSGCWRAGPLMASLWWPPSTPSAPTRGATCTRRSSEVPNPNSNLFLCFAWIETNKHSSTWRTHPRKKQCTEHHRRDRSDSLCDSCCSHKLCCFGFTGCTCLFFFSHLCFFLVNASRSDWWRWI